MHPRERKLLKMVKRERGKGSLLKEMNQKTVMRREGPK
jgi:hypothetical protein